MNNRADNHQVNNRWADNWVDKLNDVNEKKLCLFKRKKDANDKKMQMTKRCEGQKVASFLKKGGVNLHKSQKSLDIGS